MERLTSVGAGLFALLAAVVSIASFALVEIGGITYRKDCITDQGAVKKSWTVTWFAPLPFLFRPSEERCEVHTGARVALSAVGIAKIERLTVARAARAAAADPRATENEQYYALLYADLRELNDWNTAHPDMGDLPEAAQMLRKTAGRLDSLAPPDVVASQHAQLVSLFRQAASTGDQLVHALARGDRQSALNLAPEIQQANVQQRALVQAISDRLRRAGQ